MKDIYALWNPVKQEYMGFFKYEEDAKESRDKVDSEEVIKLIEFDNHKEYTTFVRRDIIRKQALAKLTLEERQVLGL